MSLLRLSGVSAKYGAQSILKNISLSLEKGEVVALVGESGSGKTTLLKAIQGLLDLDQGEILFDNERVLGPSEVLVAGHDQIKTVFQDFQLLEGLSAENNIKHELIHYSLSDQKEILDQLIVRCEMEHFRERFPSQLSGGMRQKVALAKALVDQPDLILMDEPFSNLDVLSKESFKRVIKNFQDDGVAFLYVTHDIKDALSFADRLLYLNEGELEFDVPTNRVFENLSSYQLALFMGLDNVVSQEDLTQLDIEFSEKGNYWISPDAIEFSWEEGFNDEVDEKQHLGNYFRYRLGSGLYFNSAESYSIKQKVGVKIDLSKIVALK